MHRHIPGVTGRMAVREIRRHRARSVLVVALIALPIAFASVLGVLFASSAPSPEVATQRVFGQADYRLSPLMFADGQCLQGPDDGASEPVCNGASEPTDFAGVKLGTITPAGDRYVTVGRGEVSASIQGREVPLSLVSIDAQDELLRGYLRPRPTAPLAADEVWISSVISIGFELTDGDLLRLNGADFRIVGVIDAQPWETTTVVVTPGHALAATDIDEILVAGPVPTPTEIAELNRQGIGVSTADAMLHRRSIELTPYILQMSAVQLVVGVVLALVAAAVAAAAFAIGLQQQRRLLALLGVNGATASQIGRIVTRQGLLLGLAGGLLGATVGLGGGLLWAWASWRGAGSLDAGLVAQPAAPHWLTVVGLVAVGTLAGMLASWWPTRSLRRRDLLSNIRRAQAASRPLIGNRAVGRFPLSVRLAIRELDRNRSRAVASVSAMLAVALAVSALLVWSGGAQRHDELIYRPETPVGWGRVQLELKGASDSERRAAAQTSIDAATGVLGPPTAQITVLGNSPTSGDKTVLPPAPGVPVQAASLADIETLLGDQLTDRDREILAADGLLMLTPKGASRDTVEIESWTDGAARTIEVPASHHEDWGMGALMTDTAAARWDLPLTWAREMLVRFHAPTPEERARLTTAFLLGGPDVYIQFDLGPPQGNADRGRVIGAVSVPLLILVGLVIGGLARADARSALATIAVVGASPRTLRRLGVVTVLVVVGVGLWTGLLLGTAGGVFALTRVGYPVVMPWPWLVIWAVGVPVICAAFSWGWTRAPDRTRPMREF